LLIVKPKKTSIHSLSFKFICIWSWFLFLQISETWSKTCNKTNLKKNKTLKQMPETNAYPKL